MKVSGLNTKSRAFTMVELLLVVTIIGILASLTAAAIAKGKSSAQRIQCINKLRQWGQGAHLYADDNNDKLPQEAVFDGINTWEMTMFSVCKEVWYNSMPRTIGVTSASIYSRTPSSQRSFYSPRSFFHCPAAKFAPIAATYPNFSLAMNSKLMMDFEVAPEPAVDASEMWFPSLKMSQIVVPEKTALFLDAGVAGEKRISEFQPAYSGQPKAYATEFSARHNGSGNILFAAGNVSTLHPRQVVDMDPNSPRRGGGLFPPSAVIWRHDPALVP